MQSCLNNAFTLNQRMIQNHLVYSCDAREKSVANEEMEIEKKCKPKTNLKNHSLFNAKVKLQ